MAKKKKRKLKKSVKRGCALIMSVPILVALFFLCKDFINLKDFREQKDGEGSPTEVSACLSEIHDRIDRLFQIPQRLDTATIALEVYDIDSRTVVYSRHAERLAPPASCMKLVTVIAALRYLTVDYRFVTEVRMRGEQQGSTFKGTLVFNLDDDPMVESLQPMVDAISRRGIKTIEGDIEVNILREDTLRAHHTASTWDIPYSRLPILLKGRQRIETDLRFLLSAKGIAYGRLVCNAGMPEKSDKTGENLIYRHETPLADVLAPMLIHSSNIKADALYQHMERMAENLPALNLTEGRWLLPVLGAIEAYRPDFVINDGSGLSPENRLTADFLVRLLAYAWEREDMRRVLLDEALATPVHPTRHGSLLGRMSAPLYRNKIFVKTGTLTTIGLSSLAGYAQGADGRWLIFSIINEDSPVAESRIFQDTVCKELVR